MREIIHMGLHFLVPLAVALLFWHRSASDRNRPWRAFGIMMVTMLVDLDHLLARPIFDPCRCSIGFHPLHTWPAIVIYLALTIYPRTRLIGLGLMIHMALDQIDCWMM
jgi:hypothetical protein